MSSSPSPPSYNNNNYSSSEESNKLLPLKEIPGSYGFPFFGAMKDRLDYYYNQGQDEFFRSKMEKYNSTVFRSNMPPGPFMASDPRVVVLLDSNSFPILFDTSRVEKRDVLDGTFMPSVSYTGGYRACAYLDPSEPDHTKLKGWFISLLAKLHGRFISTFRSSMSGLFVNLEDDLQDKGEADFNAISDKMSFDFVFKLFSDENYNINSLSSSENPNGASLFDLWLFFQLAPLVPLKVKFVPNFLVDFLLHTFPLPYMFVKSNYDKLYEAFEKSASSILDEAEKAGMKRDEACHNLVFMAGFNAYGGMKTTFAALMKWVGSAGEGLHRRLAEEIRAAVKESGGVNLSAINKMPLTKSTAYEVLRIEPPVPFQYGRAKEDIIVSSHDARFLIKKGEMIFGYQPFATKDPRVFPDPEKFVPDRFVGEEGEELLRYVYWSNERETNDPTAENKQCPGKDLVVLICRLMVVEFFLRYDTLTVETGTVMLGSSVTVKSITKAA